MLVRNKLMNSRYFRVFPFIHTNDTKYSASCLGVRSNSEFCLLLGIVEKLTKNLIKSFSMNFTILSLFFKKSAFSVGSPLSHLNAYSEFHFFQIIFISFKTVNTVFINCGSLHLYVKPTELLLSNLFKLLTNVEYELKEVLKFVVNLLSEWAIFG